MDIRQLKYFLTITDEGGITAAAKKLHMSQPPLSKQLMLLEEELGVKLFERRNKNLFLTNEGRVLYQQARVIAHDFDQTFQIFDDMKNGISGTLRIGCIASLAILFFPTFMKDFMKANPKLDLQMHENNTPGLFRLLDQRLAELCIVKNNNGINREKYEVINIDTLVTDEDDCLCAVALPKYFSSDKEVFDFNELKDKALIVQRFYASSITDACKECGFEPNIMSSHESVMTSLNWCLCDFGISILPYSATKLTSLLADGDKLVVKKLVNPMINSGTALVWSKAQPLSPTALQFVKSIQEMMHSTKQVTD